MSRTFGVTSNSSITRNRGVCDEWNFDPPKCQNCSGNWMGLACNDPCVNGTETPMNSGNCECDPGYAEYTPTNRRKNSVFKLMHIKALNKILNAKRSIETNV
jgi:hypothetical protein